MAPSPDVGELSPQVTDEACLRLACPVPFLLHRAEGAQNLWFGTAAAIIPLHAKKFMFFHINCIVLRDIL